MKKSSYPKVKIGLARQSQVSHSRGDHPEPPWIAAFPALFLLMNRANRFMS